MKRMCNLLVLLTLLVSGASLARSGTDAREAASTTMEIQRLSEEIATLEAEREFALRDVAERYRTAELADRSAIEAEGARLWSDFEARFLSLVVEYHTLSGNDQEAQQAQLNLEQLLAPANGEPQVQPRDLTPTPVVQTGKPVEGVQHVR